MNDIALKYHREDQQNGFYIFKPICILEGKHNEEDDTFVTTDNVVYTSITVNSPDTTEFYGGLYTPEELEVYFKSLYRDAYDKSKHEEYIKDLFNDLSKILLIGHVTADGKNVEIKAETPPAETETQKICLSLNELQRELHASIIGQDKALYELSNALFKNHIAANPALQKHILLTGPTGTGKTEMVKIICDYLHVPYYNPSVVILEDEHLFPTTVDRFIYGLIDAHDGSIQAAQRGIIHIDDLQSKLDYFHAEFLEDSLVKLMSRKKISVKGLPEKFDTSCLTVVLEGNFGKDISKDKGLGFNSKLESNDGFTGKYIYTKAGIIEKIVDKITVVETKETTYNDIKNIILYSRLSPLLANQQFYEEVGTRLECSRGFIDAVAKKVYDLKKGAKPIKSVIDESLAYVDHAAISGVIPKVKVYKKTVEDPDKFEYFK